MNLSWTDEMRTLQESLRALFTDHGGAALARDLQQPESDGFPARLWPVLASAGVFGLPFAGDAGGQDGTVFDLGICYLEAGRALCPTPVFSTMLFGLAVDRLGSEEQRQRFLTPLISGELTGTAALAAPGDGFDVRPRALAERENGTWRVSGQLAFVPNAEITDYLLTSALCPDTGATVGVIVRRGGDGWSATSLRTMSRDRQSDVRLDRVEAAAVLRAPGAPGVRADDLSWLACAAMSLQCMEMIGGAEAVLDRTVEHVKTREQFGRALASFQAVQHHVADMRIAIEGARLVALQALWRVAAGVTAERDVAIAKLKCNEAYKLVTLTAHQLHGGMGYLRETDLHFWSARAKTTELTGGAYDVQLGHLAGAMGLADGRVTAQERRHT
jgi:alkylation response protein AidB-like acyl-CoA dehydrogenase